jgi:hypothetical protein
VATLGAVKPGNWYEVDVTPSVAGDGAIAYRIVSSSPNGADYRSKEGGASFAPTLVVEFQ